jgi:hypothetical protein
MTNGLEQGGIVCEKKATQLLGIMNHFTHDSMDKMDKMAFGTSRNTFDTSMSMLNNFTE